jgi:hypothetical protein
MRNSGKEVVAVHGRYIDEGQPRMRTAGPKQLGVFSTSPKVDYGPIGIAEAPIDALSLAALGLPAVATCGTTWPEWLPASLAGRQISVAFDADGPGDAAADALGQALRSEGVSWTRLRPLASRIGTMACWPVTA